MTGSQWSLISSNPGEGSCPAISGSLQFAWLFVGQAEPRPGSRQQTFLAFSSTQFWGLPEGEEVRGEIRLYIPVYTARNNFIHFCLYRWEGVDSEWDRNENVLAAPDSKRGCFSSGQV